MPLSFLTMIVRLPRRFSSRSSTRPSISAMTAGSLGRRASKSSVTRGRPPVMSCVPPTSRGVLASRVPAVIICALLDLDARPFGDVVVGEDVPLGVLDQDLRVELALVLHDRPAGVARGVDLDPHRLALDDVLEADLAADLGEDRDVVRVPLAEHRAAGDHLAVVDLHLGTVGDVVLLELAALGVEDLDLAVARQGDLLALVVDDEVDADVLDLAVALGLDVLLLDAAGGDAADVEGAHRELGARLADRLRGDDPDRHARLDELAGGQVHAVAAPADAQATPRRSSGCGPGSSRSASPRASAPRRR